MTHATACPCGSGAIYVACCGRCIDHADFPAETAEALMRSRYTAYTLGRHDYLLATWHPTRRPHTLDDGQPPARWLGLDVRAHQTDGDRATVEFVARYKIGGRAHRLHEISRFVRENGRWFYLDGQYPESTSTP